MRLSSTSSIRIHVARARAPRRRAAARPPWRTRARCESGDDVVHPGHVRRALDVRELLAGLLHPGVEVADHRLRAHHRLAVELHHDPQHPVGRRVLRTHVDDHRLVARRPPATAPPVSTSSRSPARSSCAPSSVCAARASSSSSSSCALERRSAVSDLASRSAGRASLIVGRVFLERHRDARGRVVLAQRVAHPVVGHEDPREVGVADRT